MVYVECGNHLSVSMVMAASYAFSAYQLCKNIIAPALFRPQCCDLMGSEMEGHMHRCFCVCGKWYWSKAQLREHIKLFSLFNHTDHFEVSKAHHNEMLQDKRESMGQ